MFLYIGEGTIWLIKGGGTFLNLDSSILYIQQHNLLKQPNWIELLNIFFFGWGWVA